jgi:LysM repeat protein
VWLCGCLPLPDHDSEEKNPLIVDARAKKTAYNFQGAVASLEKALEGNPRLALAHWELGLLFCQQVQDPAAAIYHFRKLLKLRPEWRHAETARQKIKDSQIELAKSVPLGPQVPAIQQQFDALIGKVHEMEKEASQLRTANQGLRLQLQQVLTENAQLKDQWRGYAAAASNGTMQAGSPVAASSNRVAAGQPSPGLPSAPPSRMVLPDRRAEARRPIPSPPGSASVAYRQHTVKSGETMIRIAQRYGVKLRTLILANPNINPERLKVGQVVRIPAP